MKETRVAKGTLMVNGQQVAEGAIERTQAMTFSADETADVGIGLDTPVVEDIGSEAKSKFTSLSLVRVRVVTSGAILLILEMNSPFAGLMKISSAPMRDALANLGQ
ncbi:MAG: hypothetical protein ACT4QB_10695 [Gammaproteobacteria bacterium]